MRTKMFSALLLGGALLLAAGTARAALYAISYYSFYPNALYQVNTATGQVIGAGSGGLLQGASAIFGIAFSQDGTLYGLTGSDGFNTRNALYRIDPATSSATLVGPTGLSNIVKGDIAFDPVTHKLYGIEDIPGPGIMNMFTIDLTTGHATTIGSVNTGSFGGGLAALAFDPFGNLFILNTAVLSNTNLSRLLKVDKATGAVISTLDLTGAILGYSAGLAFDPATGIAYIADGNFRGTNTLYTLNTSTGVLSAVGPTGTAFRFGISSLAFSPAPAVTVAIDVKPGDDDDPPSINPTSHGKTPVAILSSPTFNAPAQIDVTSLTFGATGNEQSLAFCSGSEDINGDGLLDFVCHFRTELLGFKNPGGTVAILKGKTVTGLSLQGTDTVVIVGH